MAKQKIKKKSDNEKAIFWLIIISVFIVVFLGIGGSKVFNSFYNSDGTNNPNVEQTDNLLYLVNRDTYAATSEEYFDEMFDYFKINDQQSINKMLNENEIVVLPKGLQVNIIEYEYTFSIVREKGSKQKYWIVQEHLSKFEN